MQGKKKKKNLALLLKQVECVGWEDRNMQNKTRKMEWDLLSWGKT